MNVIDSTLVVSRRTADHAVEDEIETNIFSSVAWGGAGHGHDAETPARD